MTSAIGDPLADRSISSQSPIADRRIVDRPPASRKSLHGIYLPLWHASAKWLTDAELSYLFGGIRLAVGAQNIFDVFPDRNSTVNSFNGIQTYSRLSPFAFNGRTIYFHVGLKL